MNLLELPQDLFRMIYESLDSYSKWRELVSLADDSEYALSALEVEQCAGVIHSDYSASPTKRLLTIWGSRQNMAAETLAGFLDALKIERPLRWLKLPEPLAITVQPESRLVAVEGCALELNCEATGFPYPVYEWFKEQARIETAVSNIGRLVVGNATSAVAGFYTCRIHHTNHVTGQTEFTFTGWCSVEFKARKSEPPKSSGDYGSLPVIVEHPISRTLREKDTLVLSCEARSSSAVTYHWVKNGCLLATGQRVQIVRVNVNDAADYYCIVKNEFGEVRSHSASISVNSEAFIQAPMKPQLLREPVDLSVGIGGDAVFVVEAEYVSALSYQWLHNGESIPNACVPELRFPVEDSLCEGTYQCLVQRWAQLAYPEGNRP